jgi:hypothetical protein
MHYYEYKGFIIYPTPRLHVESGKWKIQIVIRQKQNFKIFSKENMFGTKGEAVFHCINYGKELIDEGIVAY